MHAYTNGGYQDSTQSGTLPGFFEVWYNPQSMLNILATCDVIKHFHVTMDSSIDQAIVVHFSDSINLCFTEIASGLYILNASTLNPTKEQLSVYSF